MVKTLRRRLKVLRAEREATQLQIARAAAMNGTRYWQLEHGEGLPPTPGEQLLVATALGVTVSAIDWPDRPSRPDCAPTSRQRHRVREYAARARIRRSLKHVRTREDS